MLALRKTLTIESTKHMHLEIGSTIKAYGEDAEVRTIIRTGMSTKGNYPWVKEVSYLKGGMITDGMAVQQLDSSWEVGGDSEWLSRSVNWNS